MTIKSCMVNLRNGNLSDAKFAAKQYSFAKLAEGALVHLGYSQARALAAAAYLKGAINFQQYCDTP